MGEPLNWGATLVLVDDACYSEVSGQVVAVVPETAMVVSLTPHLAALVAALDGRPLREVFANELAGWDATQSQRIIESLRRIKALGLVVDAAPNARATKPDWYVQAPLADEVILAGTTRGDGALVLSGSGEERVVIRRGGAPGNLVLSTPTTSEPTSREVFVALVEAVSPRRQLRESGRVDLLAAISETWSVLRL